LYESKDFDRFSSSGGWYAVFEFKVDPVVDVMDAVAVEVKAIEYRKKNAP
jgi:hypothetical protein